MRLLYGPDGTIHHAVYDSDLFRFTHTTKVPLTKLEIDEIGESNQRICRDVATTLRKWDSNHLTKYYVEAGELHVRDGWVEAWQR